MAEQENQNTRKVKARIERMAVAIVKDGMRGGLDVIGLVNGHLECVDCKSNVNFEIQIRDFDTIPSASCSCGRQYFVHATAKQGWQSREYKENNLGRYLGDTEIGLEVTYRVKPEEKDQKDVRLQVE